jgi:hypothetical protein
MLAPIGFTLPLALLIRENSRATGNDDTLQIVKKRAHSNNQNLSTLRDEGEPCATKAGF